MMRNALAALGIVAALNLGLLVYVLFHLQEVSGEFGELASLVDSLVQEHADLKARVEDIDTQLEVSGQTPNIQVDEALSLDEMAIVLRNRAYGKQVEYRFGDLLKTLELDDDTTEEFVDVEIAFDIAATELDISSPYDVDARRELESRRMEAVSELLGSNHIHYRDYVHSYEDRRLVGFYSKRFLSTSLDDSTKEQLIAELSAVSENHPIPPLPRLDEDLGIRIEMGRIRLNAIKAADQEKIERAQSYLTQEQFAGFENYFRLQHKRLEDNLLSLEKRLR